MILKQLPAKLLGYRVLVELDDLRKQTELNLPENSDPFDRTHGEVCMIGDGLNVLISTTPMPIPVKIFDRVLLADVGYEPIGIGDRCFRLVSVEDILAILKPTIGQIEKIILAQDSGATITVNPDGSIKTP